MKRFCIAAVFLVFAASPARPQTSDPIQTLAERVVSHTLKNGMKVLVLERRTAPLVSFQMMFRTGGVDEVSGKSGLAHLFEHMMFKGSKTVGTKDYEKEKVLIDKIDRVARALLAEESKGEKADAKRIESLRAEMQALEEEHRRWIIPSEFDQIYQQEGGEGLNAFTGKDMTGFVVSLPANKWELWPILESDRMAHPVLREFYKERDVVMEERRMRYDNSPQGKLWESFNAAAFIAHPYNLPTIGWMSDLKALTQSDAEEFFRTHYAPNNAAVAIVGDVSAEDVIAKLESYFAKVPSQPLDARHVTEEPPQSGERRVRVAFDSEPSLLIGYHKPNAPHPDHYAMDMLEQVASRGRTSRFHRNIVDKKIALSAWASNGNPGERYPNCIIFGGSPRKPHGNPGLERAILAELEALKREKVSERVLTKIRNQVEADFIRTLDSNSGLASQLVYNQVVLGDWRNLFRYLEAIRKVTPDDVQRVAALYLTDLNRTVAVLERRSDGGN